MNVIKLTKANFNSEAEKSSVPVLIDFYADWCGPCRMMAPIIDEISDERSDIKVCKVNIDEEAELAEKFGVMSIPTLAVMKNGKTIEISTGARPKQDVLTMLDNAAVK